MMKLFRVSVLIRNTRQSMSCLFFAEDEETAKEMYLEHTSIPRKWLAECDFVSDEIPIEEGFVANLHNDREVYEKYFLQKEMTWEDVRKEVFDGKEEQIQ